MLINVLKEIYKAKVFSKNKIAANLNITESALDQMIEQLVHMGYIKEEMGSPTCENKCIGCSISCHVTPIKMLSITKKGILKINNN
jgi:predicted transcriptional regulator